MSGAFTANAQAILLLTAPLLPGGLGRKSRTAGKSGIAARPSPLSTAEYRDFARQLRAIRREPGDLLESEAADTLRESGTKLDNERIHRLLGRGFMLAHAVEHWHARALWVLTRADPDYPRRLKKRMRGNAPPVLYGCGDRVALDGGGLAVVGSRKVGEDLLLYAADAGRLAAEAETAIVSGGARGIDQAAMMGALEAGGRSVGVLANNLERAALSHFYRDALMQGRLALVSPYDPAVQFQGWRAMQRNKFIYALSDAALVVNSVRDTGGTWAGASEQLTKLKFVRVLVRDAGEHCDGNKGLMELGAAPWPNPKTPEELQRVVGLDPLPTEPAAVSEPTEAVQGNLFPPAGSRVRERQPEDGDAGGRENGPTGNEPRIDINRVTAEELCSLPGIGKVTAGRIVDYRKEHEGFRSVAELKDVSGIGDAIFSRIEALVKAGR